MTRTADPRPPPLDPLWLAFGLVPLVFLLSSPAPAVAADDALAVALVCPAGVEAPDCSRANALDVLSQPAGPLSCLKVGAELATHLAYGPGERAKVVCERRKG
jgi:hypothetical protein